MTKKKKDSEYKMASEWTEEEVAILTDMAGKFSSADIARKLNRTGNAVKGKIDRMGLPRYVKQYYERLPTQKPIVGPYRYIPPPPPPTLINGQPALRQPIKSHTSHLEWCPSCGSPVSNWQEHRERVGCRRQA